MLCCFLTGLAMAAVGQASAPSAVAAPSEPGGFKIVYREYQLGTEPILRGEIVVLNGRWYQFHNINNEIVIVDPKRAKVELIDLSRKAQSEVTFARLDEATQALKKVVVATIEKKEKEGGRANAIASKMSRDLIEPTFQVVRDEAGGVSKLSNETVQVEAKGEPDSDAVRLSRLGVVLSRLVQLDSLRNPTKIPPFPQLLTIEELTDKRKLRPLETTYIYRMTGKPIKQRWTFRFVPELTDREKQAIDKIIQIQGLAKVQRLEAYDRER